MIVECEGQPTESVAPEGVPLEILCDGNLSCRLWTSKGVHRHPEGVPTEPAVLRKKSIRFSLNGDTDYLCRWCSRLHVLYRAYLCAPLRRENVSLGREY